MWEEEAERTTDERSLGGLQPSSRLMGYITGDALIYGMFPRTKHGDGQQVWLEDHQYSERIVGYPETNLHSEQ